MINQSISCAELVYYTKLIRESSQPMESVPVTLPSEWNALIPSQKTQVLNGIRAVLFDLYGTLFISGAGEISVASAESTPARTTMPDDLCNAVCIEEMKQYFSQAVKQRHKKAKTEGNPWPEVLVEEIWTSYKGSIPPGWDSLQKMRDLASKIGPCSAQRSAGRELAVRYELAINPVFPMPHAEEMLRSLAARGFKLGIISNAQFFSPLLFNAFFNAPPEELGFDPDLLVYSFEENEAKPSLRLFAGVKEILDRQNISGEETLYIGNDMRNDIIPAATAGFKTALFAGDSRSLRLREDDPACAGKKPDMVICDLQTLAMMPDTTI